MNGKAMPAQPPHSSAMAPHNMLGENTPQKSAFSPNSRVPNECLVDPHGRSPIGRSPALQQRAVIGITDRLQKWRLWAESRIGPDDHSLPILGNTGFRLHGTGMEPRTPTKAWNRNRELFQMPRKGLETLSFTTGSIGVVDEIRTHDPNLGKGRVAM